MVFLKKISLNKGIFGLNSLKSCKDGRMIRKSSLAKGMFTTKISLVKGIRWKTGAALPRKILCHIPLDVKHHWAQCVKNNYNRMEPFPIGEI